MRALMSKTIVATVTAVILLLNCDLSWAQEGSKIPKEIRLHQRRLLGTWMLEGNIGAAAIEGKWNARWAPGRVCLLLTWLPHDESGESIAAERAVALLGWNSLTEELVESQFRIGTTGSLRLRMRPDKKLTGEWQGVYKGKPAKATDTFEWINENKWKISWKAVENFEDGEIVATRISTPRKKPEAN
jgi:hypothetical protein